MSEPSPTELIIPEKKSKKIIIKKPKHEANVKIEDPDKASVTKNVKSVKSVKSVKPCANEISFHNYKILEDKKEKKKKKKKK